MGLEGFVSYLDEARILGVMGGVVVGALALALLALRNLLWQRWLADAALRAGWTLARRPGWRPRIVAHRPGGQRVVLHAAFGRPVARIRTAHGVQKVRGPDTPEALVAAVEHRFPRGGTEPVR